MNLVINISRSFDSGVKDVIVIPFIHDWVIESDHTDYRIDFTLVNRTSTHNVTVKFLTQIEFDDVVGNIKDLLSNQIVG